MGCEIKYIGSTEPTNVPCVSVQLICATATRSYHQKMFKKIIILKKVFLHSSCSELRLRHLKNTSEEVPF